MYCFCCYKTHRLAPKFSLHENRKAWLRVAGRWELANLVGGSARRGPLLGEPSASAVGQQGESRAAGSVQLRNEVAQTLRTAKKLTPYRAWSAAPDVSGGFWDKGRESPTAGHSRTYQAFCFLGELSQIWGDLSQIFKPVTQPCQGK